MSNPAEPPSPTPPDSPPLAYADPATPHHQQLLPLNRWDSAVIILKLVGLYLLLFQALPYLWACVGILFEGAFARNSWVVLFYLGTLVAIAGVGVLLLVLAERLARWLLPRAARSDMLPTAPMTSSAVQQIAFSVVGVCLVGAMAIPGFASDLVSWITVRQLVQAQLHPDLGPSLAEHVVQLIVGIWLFFGSRQLGDYWHRIRSGRREQREDSPL